MARQLIFTSAPQGLKRGTSGYAIVAMTDGIPDRLTARLESLSSYQHVYELSDPRYAQNPVRLRMAIIDAGGKRYRVASRIVPCGADHTGRANVLAHHLILDDAELKYATPLSFIVSADVWLSSWSGDPRSLPPLTLPSKPTAPVIPKTWTALTGDADWAKVPLSLGAQPVNLILPDGVRAEDIIAETISSVPSSEAWSATFDSYFTDAGHGVETRIRCLLASMSDRRGRIDGVLIDVGGTLNPALLKQAQASRVIATKVEQPAAPGRIAVEWVEDTPPRKAVPHASPNVPPAVPTTQVQPRGSSGRFLAWTTAVLAVVVLSLAFLLMHIARGDVPPKHGPDASSPLSKPAPGTILAAPVVAPSKPGNSPAIATPQVAVPSGSPAPPLPAPAPNTVSATPSPSAPIAATSSPGNTPDVATTQPSPAPPSAAPDPNLVLATPTPVVPPAIPAPPPPGNTSTVLVVTDDAKPAASAVHTVFAETATDDGRWTPPGGATIDLINHPIIEGSPIIQGSSEGKWPWEKDISSRMTYLSGQGTLILQHILVAGGKTQTRPQATISPSGIDWRLGVKDSANNYISSERYRGLRLRVKLSNGKTSLCYPPKQVVTVYLDTKFADADVWFSDCGLRFTPNCKLDAHTVNGVGITFTSDLTLFMKLSMQQRAPKVLVDYAADIATIRASILPTGSTEKPAVIQKEHRDTASNMRIIIDRVTAPVPDVLIRDERKVIVASIRFILSEESKKVIVDGESRLAAFTLADAKPPSSPVPKK